MPQIRSNQGEYTGSDYTSPKKMELKAVKHKSQHTTENKNSIDRRVPMHSSVENNIVRNESY